MLSGLFTGGRARADDDAPALPAAHRAVPRRPAAAQGVRAALHRHDQGVPEGRPAVRRRADHRGRRGRDAAAARPSSRTSARSRDHATGTCRSSASCTSPPRAARASRSRAIASQPGRSSSPTSPTSPNEPQRRRCPPTRSRSRELLELIATRVGPQNFPAEPDYDDASWVGYRLAEFLPLPLPIKQSMLEINDAACGCRCSQSSCSSRG